MTSGTILFLRLAIFCVPFSGTMILIITILTGLPHKYAEPSGMIE